MSPPLLPPESGAKWWEWGTSSVGLCSTGFSPELGTSHSFRDDRVLLESVGSHGHFPQKMYIHVMSCIQNEGSQMP